MDDEIEKLLASDYTELSPEMQKMLDEIFENIPIMNCELIIESTPFGEKSYFYELWKKNA